MILQNFGRVGNVFPFFGYGSPLSNLYRCSFTNGKQTFISSEQYFQFIKADMFNDFEIASRILQEQNPFEQKALGRQITGYVDETWQQFRVHVMLDAIMLKFSADNYLKMFLLNTKDMYLMETNLTDRYWGAGVAATESNLRNCYMPGKNVTGQLLMNARKFFQEGGTDYKLRVVRS